MKIKKMHRKKAEKQQDNQLIFVGSLLHVFVISLYDCRHNL